MSFQRAVAFMVRTHPGSSPWQQQIWSYTRLSPWQHGVNQGHYHDNMVIFKVTSKNNKGHHIGNKAKIAFLVLVKVTTLRSYPRSLPRQQWCEKIFTCRSRQQV